MFLTKSFPLYKTGKEEGWEHYLTGLITISGKISDMWSHKDVELDRLSSQTYQIDHKGLSAYNDSVRLRHREPHKDKEHKQKYWDNKLKGDKKASINRGLGHVVVYDGSNFGDVFLHGHHITNMYVIYIPADFHRGCYTGDRGDHRDKVWRELKLNHYAIFKIIEKEIAKYWYIESELK